MSGKVLKILSFEINDIKNTHVLNVSGDKIVIARLLLLYLSSALKWHKICSQTENN